MTTAALTLLLQSCKTVEIKTEYTFPELDFPVFPAMPEIERKDGFCLVPDTYIMELARYKVRIKETEKNYMDMRKIYKEAEK